MMFGWKAKAEKLRTVLVTVGHQPARPLPPGVAQIMEIFRHVVKTGDGRRLKEIAQIMQDTADKPLWEPAEIHGWKIQAAMYLDNHPLTSKQCLWWLIHAVHKKPTAKDTAILRKIVEHLGADSARDCVIGPGSELLSASPPPFAWYTWINSQPLFERQFKGYGKTTQSRIVPYGTPGTDGFEPIELRPRAQG